MMADEYTKALADQVDVLADKVSRLEHQMTTLVEALTRDDTAERLGFTISEVGHLKFRLTRLFAASEHQLEREHKAREASKTRV